MAIKVSIYDTRTLLEAINQRMPVNTFLRSTFFTETKKFPTKTVDVDFRKGRRKMAPFVNPRLPGQVMDRQGFQTSSFTPACIKPKIPITVDDLVTRSFGEEMYSGMTPEERARELLAGDMVYLDDLLSRREEWMAASVLFTGKVDMIGEGVNATLDFQFTNKEVLTGTNLWTDPLSDPIAYLKNKRLAVIQKSGLTVDRCIMASDVVDAFINHSAVQALMDNKGFNIGKIDPSTLPNGVTYIGTITALGLELYSYDEWYVDEDSDPENPVEKSMVPAGTICLISTRARFGFHYGAITLIDEKTDDFKTYMNDRVPQVYSQRDPATRFIQMHSAPLPIPYEVDSWYIAKVI